MNGLPPLALADDQLEAGPNLADGADLDVHEPHREGNVSNRILGDVGLDLRGLLGPRDPDEPRGLEGLAQDSEALREVGSPRHEDVRGGDRVLALGREGDTLWKL